MLLLLLKEENLLWLWQNGTAIFMSFAVSFPNLKWLYAIAACEHFSFSFMSFWYRYAGSFWLTCTLCAKDFVCATVRCTKCRYTYIYHLAYKFNKESLHASTTFIGCRRHCRCFNFIKSTFHSNFVQYKWAFTYTCAPHSTQQTVEAAAAKATIHLTCTVNALSSVGIVLCVKRSISSIFNFYSKHK